MIYCKIEQSFLCLSHLWLLQVSVILCLSFCLAVYGSLSVSQSVSQSDNQTHRQSNNQTHRQSVRLSVCLSFYLSVCLSFYLSIYLSVWLPHWQNFWLCQNHSSRGPSQSNVLYQSFFINVPPWSVTKHISCNPVGIPKCWRYLSSYQTRSSSPTAMSLNER